MDNTGTSLIQEISWQEARTRVYSVDKTLAGLIDDISPHKSYKLIKVVYSYGDLIFKDGVLHLPKEK